MTKHRDENVSSVSTTWALKRVKVGQAPQAGSHSPRKGSSLRSRSRLDPRKPLTISVTYRGGAEAWWEIRARGCIIRRPGWQSIHDVLWEISQGGGA
jgi:hypothetical protein